MIVSMSLLGINQSHTCFYKYWQKTHEACTLNNSRDFLDIGEKFIKLHCNLSKFLEISEFSPLNSYNGEEQPIRYDIMQQVLTVWSVF